MRRFRIFFSVVLLVAFLLSSVLFLSSCKKPPEEEEEPLKMVFLGDSIAEGILGPSPVNERDFYGYYGVLSKRNGYLGINRAVSGHQTSHMLAYIKREDEGASMVQTHLKTADIIAISILGNDLLNLDIGKLLKSVLVDNDDTLLTDGLSVAGENFAGIIETLRGYNPNAVILVQTLYNPAFPETTLVSQPIKAVLADNGIEPDQYREESDFLIGELNGIIYDYLETHPGAFHIVDVYQAFDDVYEENPARGKALFYGDWVHPSNEGHAVIANTIQKKLEELSLADKDSAISKYKQLRYEQMLRLFPNGLDHAAIKSEIDAAKTCDEVSEIYFRMTAGKTPAYTAWGQTTKTTGELVTEDVVLPLTSATAFAFNDTILGIVVDKKNSNITLGKDGICSINVALLPAVIPALNTLLDGVDFENLDLFGSDLNGFLEIYAGTGLFPGFEIEDIQGGFDIVKASLGVSLIGFDFEEPPFAGVATALAEGGTIPSDFRLPTNREYGIVLTAPYTIREVESPYSGKYTAVYIGQLRKNEETYVVMTANKDEEGEIIGLKLRVEFLPLDIVVGDFDS